MNVFLNNKRTEKSVFYLGVLVGFSFYLGCIARGRQQELVHDVWAGDTVVMIHEVEATITPKVESSSTIVVGEVREIHKDDLELTTEPQVNDIEAYIHEVFGEDAEDGIKILKECENKSMKTDAVNWNRNGSWDFGLWQINSVHGYTQEQLSDHRFNTDVAYKIFKNRGWSAWTCSWVVGVKSFWEK